MNKRQIVRVAIAGLACAIVGALAGRYVQQHFAQDDAVTEKIARPETLPAFTLYDLDGNAVTKDALLANDKALFINFWATWCKPCRKEMPLLVELQNEYSDRLLMVGVAIDNAAAVQKFLDHLGGVNYPILLGKQELDAIETAYAMGTDLVGLPVTVTADSTGRIVRIHVGEVHRAEAVALIEEAL